MSSSVWYSGVRDQQVLGEEGAIAVRLRQAQVVQQRLKGLQHSPSDQVLLAPRHRLDGTFAFGPASRHAQSKAPRTRQRNSYKDLT